MAIEVLVEYTVAEGMEAEADSVRAAFLEGIAGWEPEKFTYRILRKGDGNEYVHLAWLDSRDTQLRLFETDFFKAFDEGIRRVSGESVVATPLVEWSTPG